MKRNHRSWALPVVLVLACTVPPDDASESGLFRRSGLRSTSELHMLVDDVSAGDVLRGHDGDPGSPEPTLESMPASSGADRDIIEGSCNGGEDIIWGGGPADRADSRGVAPLPRTNDPDTGSDTGSEASGGPSRDAPEGRRGMSGAASPGDQTGHASDIALTSADRISGRVGAADRIDGRDEGTQRRPPLDGDGARLSVGAEDVIVGTERGPDVVHSYTGGDPFFESAGYRQSLIPPALRACRGGGDGDAAPDPAGRPDQDIGTDRSVDDILRGCGDHTRETWLIQRDEVSRPTHYALRLRCGSGAVVFCCALGDTRRRESLFSLLKACDDRYVSLNDADVGSTR